MKNDNVGCKIASVIDYSFWKSTVHVWTVPESSKQSRTY